MLRMYRSLFAGYIPVLKYLISLHTVVGPDDDLPGSKQVGLNTLITLFHLMVTGIDIKVYNWLVYIFTPAWPLRLFHL
jgi:hypothetical protein